MLKKKGKYKWQINLFWSEMYYNVILSVYAFKWQKLCKKWLLVSVLLEKIVTFLKYDQMSWWF